MLKHHLIASPYKKKTNCFKKLNIKPIQTESGERDPVKHRRWREREKKSEKIVMPLPPLDPVPSTRYSFYFLVL